MAAKSELKSTWIVLRPRSLRFSYRMDKRVPLVALAILLFTGIVLI